MDQPKIAKAVTKRMAQRFQLQNSGGESAQEQLENQKRRFDENMRSLASVMKTFTIRAGNRPNDWSVSGTLSHVNDKLDEAIASLVDASTNMRY